MVAAQCAVVDRLSVLVGRTDANRHLRNSGDRLDRAYELDRPKNAAVLTEAWGEIRDLDRGALCVGEDGGNDRRVALIAGRKAHHVFQHDIAKPLLLVAGEQTREDGIAVETGIAPPNKARGG